MRYIVRHIRHNAKADYWVVQLKPLAGIGLDSLRSKMRPDLKPGDHVVVGLHTMPAQPTPPAAVAA